MLSPAAEKLIDQYLNLPFPGIANVRCPYYNNTRAKQRGQLRVLIGKGSPQEIVEESKIISIQYHKGIFQKNGECCTNLSSEDIRKFLIDYSLGIECSGFVSQILRTHFLETKGVDFTKKISIVSPRRVLRYLITRLRPIESISVKVLTDNRNSEIVSLEQIQPGDFITMLETGPLQKRNHILLVRNVEGNTIEYVHARAWSSEGRYDHGVMAGTIVITKPQGNLLEQQWQEKDCEGEKNETFLEAKNAKLTEIRRLKI